MIVKIQPSKLSGNVHAPASKSSMQRACAAALVRKGETIIRNPGKSNDDIAGLNVIQTLGAEVYDLEDGSLKIISEGVDPVSNSVNNGEAGLGIRIKYCFWLYKPAGHYTVRVLIRSIWFGSYSFFLPLRMG